MRGMMLLLVVALLLPVSAAAQESEPFYAIAPVQVEMSDGIRQYSFDCYPSAPPENEVRMSVYFNTPNGIAVYACHVVGRAVIWPAVSSFRGFNLAGLFKVTIPEGGEA